MAAMPNELEKVFNLLPGFDIIIVGSSVYKTSAKDIDVLFMDGKEFETACFLNNLKWGGWDANYGHVRRANVTLEGVDKPVQFIHVGSVAKPEDHPHILIMRDGTILHPKKIYIKPDGKYDKGIQVDRRKENGKWLAIDFDGTIRDWDTSKPFPGARDAINLLREHGHKIMIHSCNNPTWIEQWLDDYDIRFDSIWGYTNPDCGHKPIAALYIDDRGYHFKSNWPEDVKEILSRLKTVPERG